ncbi:hydrogenase maturation nickel metallochaperone HypA/HybF [Rubrivivax albus]|uniref:Hydrogenase maturation factor HypA n=1 Tax=Rubrivivax albus TaxID=2499835 RepID=A0A437JT45_9BURK|nr:hydrogenase maturation nickel metallochaperone HypA [Rubrivivax albus]RVT50107.1 hydrogenase maturation nickel metallochaperone HypA [Rubrivivax albus]
MHEMSLAGGILKLVDDAAARDPFTRVKCLVLDCGALAGVEVHALRFALEAIAPGTRLDGAEIVVHEPPGQAFCMSCGQRVEIMSRVDPCPACGSFKLQPTGGLDLTVRELIVHEEAEN